MAQIILTTNAPPSSPSSATVAVYPDSTNLLLTAKDANGVVRTIGPITNANTGDVTANAANTYLTGSSITIPPALLRAGATFRWVFAMSKTNAGIAQPAWTVVFGTAGTTSDSARLTFTATAQTGAVDNGIATIDAVVRSNGASGVLEGVFSMTHTLAATNQTTGLQTQATQVLQATSAGFDMTVATSIIGVCCNPGASGVWTFQHVSVQGFNL